MVEFDPDIPDDAPDELKAFGELDAMDNYAEELADLIELLGEQLQVLNLVEANGNFAAVVPHYDEEPSESEMDDLLEQTGENEVPMIVVDGEPGIITED